MKILCLLIAAVLCPACSAFTDPATRLADDMKAGAHGLAGAEGATYSIRHSEPSKAGECTGNYKVQIDKAGALIVWCKDSQGKTVSSHSTSYHAQFVDTPRTYIVDKPAGSTLTILLERRSGRAVISHVE